MGTTLRINDFLLNHLQGTIFTPAYRVVPMTIMGKLSENLASKFDGAPTVLPLPAEVPPDFPRLIFKSKDDQWGLQIASARTTYRWVQMAESQQKSVTEFAREFLDFLGGFLKIENPRIGRMALVLYRYLLISDPASILPRHFCREVWLKSALSSSRAFELHSHRRTKIGNTYDVNSWIRFKTGQLSIPNTPKRPIVLVEQDVNTLPEQTDTAAYSMEDLRSFFTLAQQEMDNCFKAFLEA